MSVQSLNHSLAFAHETNAGACNPISALDRAGSVADRVAHSSGCLGRTGMSFMMGGISRNAGWNPTVGQIEISRLKGQLGSESADNEIGSYCNFRNFRWCKMHDSHCKMPFLWTL